MSDAGRCNFVCHCGCWISDCWRGEMVIPGLCSWSNRREDLGPRFGAWFVYTCRVGGCEQQVAETENHFRVATGH